MANNLCSAGGPDLNLKKLPTVGIFPAYFPRDTIDINTYMEHMLLGQVLEPLVETDLYGKIKPGVAKKWIFKNEKIVFFLDETKKFSNGKSVAAKDVVFSLKRHLFGKSQSSNLLTTIKEINILSEYKVEIVVSEKRVSLIKALSREQLGILPHNWIFDKNSSEPYIGSGDYRLVKEGDEWLLKLIHPAPGKVKVWKLILGDLSDLLKMSDLPTYAPVVMENIYKELIKKSKVKEYHIGELNSFTQSSAWLLKGKNVSLKKMSVINEFFEKISKKIEANRVTGVIPKGIPGYLTSSPLPGLPKVEKFNKEETINISVLAFMFNEINHEDIILDILNKYNVRIKLFSVTVQSLQNELEKNQSDLIVARWGGGFNDPEGFLAILSRVLSTPFEDYLGELNTIYSQAKKEENSEKRAELFRELNKSIVLHGKMLPLWDTKVYYSLDHNYKIDRFYNRYSPRFIDVEKK